jgi:ABC-type proline/glycine betaine transport system ATPase subunit
MSKFTYAERNLIKNIVACLTIKRIPDNQIIKSIFEQTNKTMTVRHLTRIRQQIKKESYHWYKTMREGQYEYIHEFKERIDEILWLQRKHHSIIDSDKELTTVKQASMAELHRLNITLSNYFDVAPDIIGHTISAPSTTEAKATQPERNHIV